MPAAAVVVGLVHLADPGGMPELSRLLGTIHGLLGSGVSAGIVFVAMLLVSVLASGALFVIDAGHRLLAIMAVAGPMAMAPIGPIETREARLSDIPPPSPPQSEIQFGAYLGGSIAAPSDVVLKAPDGTDLTLKNVRWWSESLIDSPYYGARGIKWSETLPHLGSMVDFTHCKATAYEQKVEQSGTLKGEPVPPVGAFEDTFRKLEYTHGFNSLTMNGIYRVTRLHPRIRPYFALGLGVMVPHIDSERAGFPGRETKTLEPQVTGPVFQALAGVEWRIFVSDRYSHFTEYKLAYSQNTARLRPSGTVSTNFLISQFAFGLSSYVWRAAPAAAP